MCQYECFPVAKKEILNIMSKAIMKPRTTRKENGPVIGKLSMLSFAVTAPISGDVMDLCRALFCNVLVCFCFPCRERPRARFQKGQVCWTRRLQPP